MREARENYAALYGALWGEWQAHVKKARPKANIALARKLLEVAPPPEDEITDEPEDYRPPCPHCGGHMIVIETFARWQQPRAPPSSIPPIRKFAP